MRRISIVFLIGAFLSACSFDRISFVEIPVSKNRNDKTAFGKNGIDFSWVKINVFQAGQCLKCHGEGSRLDLSTYVTTMAAVGHDGKKLVVPGDYENSKLFKDVESGRMPKNGQKLNEDLIYALAVWINMGAFEGALEKKDPKEEEIPDIAEVDFEFLKNKIFDPKCNTCHGPDGEAFYVDLTTRDGTLQKVNLVEPMQSRLYKSVLSGRMPQGGPRLTDSEIAVLPD